MMKKLLICGLFLCCFCAAWFLMYSMRQDEKSVETVVEEVKVVNDSMHAYSIEDLKSECASDDKIFCAIERVVKCTIAPELEVCDKELVPNFVLGKTEEVVRPKNISFEIVKIKPSGEDGRISVYTKSDCDEVWFGLCKGTVIYSLTPVDGEKWAVTNLFALE